jgi:hypothetical protein
VIIEYLATVWRLPDEGIWEIRGDPRHFVHSKVMAWVAFDRAAAYVETGLPELSRKWREIADEIHADVCERGFDRELGSFVQAYGSKGVDASLLLLPLVGFLPVRRVVIRRPHVQFRNAERTHCLQEAFAQWLEAFRGCGGPGWNRVRQFAVSNGVAP